MPPELELLANKRRPTRLGFALLLKFFQHEARFPEDVQEIPGMIIDYVAKQTGVGPGLHRQYDWEGRSIKYHRAQLRELHGFREPTVEDANALVQWLGASVLSKERDQERLKNAVYRRCRELRIDPPTPERIDRLVRSATRTYEENFCAEILARLSPENQTSLDALPPPGVARLLTYYDPSSSCVSSKNSVPLL